uniref:CAZy families CBM50 protein n=1 Tax=uncultured Desulfotomaculum sp. TaxID=157294 RepID=A0A060CS39_9FIRM|nr:CAZy families CBM50 protein [uncultured Desulfotomaculum sp.]
MPAGLYAKAWLEKIGLWDAVKARVVPAEHVRAALAVVESGNAGAGIVYRTDAAISKKVKVALEVPATEVPAIRYPAAVLKDARHPAEGEKFLRWLSGGKARAIFVKFGFSPLP